MSTNAGGPRVVMQRTRQRNHEFDGNGWRRQINRLLLAIGLLASTANAGNALAPPSLRDYAVDRWTTVQGLPHNSIRGIAQTPEGHLWFGTWEGLVSYNGLEFSVLDRASKPGLLDNGIGALYRDPAGELWISDSRGNVGHRDAEGELRFSPRPPDLPEVLIQSMTMDHSGRLWLLYESKGLGYLGADGIFHYAAPPPDSPLRTASTRMAIDEGNRLWIGSYGGLLFRELDGDGIVRRAPDDFGLPAGLAWPYRAPDGRLWIAAEDSLYRIEEGRPVFRFRIPDKGRLTAMLQDRHGQLWLGTENLGLFRLTERFGLERMRDDLDLPGGRITEIFEDAEGSIWVGANGGLFRLRETLFSNYTQRDGLSGDYIRAVLEDRNGRLWVGSAGGLDRMDADGSITPLRLPTTSGNSPSVLSLAEDAEGGLWIGTYVDGLYRLDPSGSIRHLGAAEGLPSGNVRSITVDDQGIIWLGTQRGVARLQDNRARMLEGEHAPTGLTTALSSQPGELWIGSIEGARLLRGTQIQRIDLAALGGGRSVFGFRRLGNDMWIVSDRGLYRHRDGVLARVGLEQGMPVDAMFEMLPDRSGNVWITSNRGVLRTTQAALDAVADGLGSRIEVDRYSEMDGMVSAQANGSTGPAAWLRKDNTLWVATASGLSTVDPARLPTLSQHAPPPTVIETIAVEGQPLPLGSANHHVSLPGGKRLTVGYVGLSFLLPERVVYRTRLDGLDHDWIERGRQRNVEFIGLPPGDYGLHIAAAHPGGAWGTKEAVWRFSVEPFWWQRLDVQAMAALLALIALLAIYRYLVARYRASNLKLTRLVDERTEDLQRQTRRLLHADDEKTRLLDQLREQSESFERQAREDALTGLPNRRAFDLALKRALEAARREQRPLSLAMLDVDHFKSVNDNYSHSIGDTVLREVGRLLIETSRASDFSARVGGEEFALIFHDTTLSQARSTCERLRQAFHAQADWAGVTDLKISFSAGLAEWNGEGESESALVQRADDALYQAKQDGRDRICIG